MTDRAFDVSDSVSVVILGYGAEEYLESCLASVVPQLRPGDEVVLVDNGIADATQRASGWPEQVAVLRPGTNLGFAGGTVEGAARTTGTVLAFVNSDAVLRPGALSRLVDALRDPGVGLAGGCLRLADRPDLVNSAGNPLHFTGITWAGHCGEPADRHTTPADVAVATGGLFALRRSVWDELGGFDPMYFAYHEDTDLSVRVWLSGRRVRFVPDAVADHHYEFSRSPLKMYLVERNRLITVLTDYPSVLLAAVLPALVVTEPLLLVQSLLQGWGRQKVASWGWLVAHRHELRERRRRVQSAVRTAPGSLSDLMVARIEPPMVDPPPGMGLLNGMLVAYWRPARRLVRRAR